MLKITIVNEDHIRKEIKNAGVVYEQKGYVHLDGEPFPKEIRLSQWVNRETGEVPHPYKKGDYTFTKNSFSVGKYGSLDCRPNLVPITSKSV